MKTLPYILTANSLTVFIDGDQWSIARDHSHFDGIVAAIRANEWDKIPDLIDKAKGLRKFFEPAPGDTLTVTDGAILYNGDELSGYAVDFILRMQGEGFDVNPLLAYLARLQHNPSMRNRQDQFEWLQRGNMPITPDGYILAFKKVRDDYKDYRSGSFDNSPGKVVEVPRRNVDDNIERTCSFGLHFCSRTYLPHYYGNEGRLLVLQIDPADIVAFPRDYDVSKGRCCRYTVLGEIPEDQVGNAFGESVSVWGDADEIDEVEEVIDNVVLGLDLSEEAWRVDVASGTTTDSHEGWSETLREAFGDWQVAVECGDTTLGFTDWLADR